MMMVTLLMMMMFLSSVQPMMMVFLLLVVALLYSIFMYQVMMTFWYSIVLMLIMMSGVLVVFTYMASMVPNEKFIVHYEVIFLSFFFVMGVIDIMWGDEYSSSMNCLWSSSMMYIDLFLVSFLLVVMLMVVWVSDWGMMSASSYCEKFFGKMMGLWMWFLIF